MADMLKSSRPPALNRNGSAGARRLDYSSSSRSHSFCPTVLTKNAPDEAGAPDVWIQAARYSALPIATFSVLKPLTPHSIFRRARGPRGDRS
jgi:hypothetical protein